MVRFVTQQGEAKVAALENEHYCFLLTNFGASIYAVEEKQPDGSTVDLVLTCRDPEAFTKSQCFFGATVGRVANRIGKGTFTLGGKEYQLTKNDGQNSAHGGHKTFARRFWDMELTEDAVIFTLESPDGEEGYPGNLKTKVTYRLDAEGRLEITHEAVSDKDTILGYTNHAYWCLGGMGKKIYEQKLQIFGDVYVETDAEIIPTGQILSVKGTPYDFTEPTALGEHIRDDFPPVQRNRGYDVSFVRRDREGTKAAVLTDPASGRKLEVFTTMPIIHIYSGNFLDNEPGKDGSVYNPHDAICLEAGRYPDAINHAHFGPAILHAGEHFCEKIWFQLTK